MTRYLPNISKNIDLAVVCKQVGLMFLADAFQYDLMIKLIYTTTTIFDCLVSTLTAITSYPISLRQLCHIVLYNIIPIILFQPFQVGYPINANIKKFVYSFCSYPIENGKYTLLECHLKFEGFI